MDNTLDEDLNGMSREELMVEIRRLRRGVRLAAIASCDTSLRIATDPGK